MSEVRATTEPGDETLMSRIASGDASAFELFYQRHAGLLWGLALRILGNPADAEDVVQEALVLIWERAAAYQPRLGRPLSWAVTLTRNKAVDRLRSALRREQLAASDLPLPSTVDPAGDPAAASSVAEASGAVVVALGRLPAAQRQALELAFFGGLSQTEIAARLGEPLGTIKARIRRGMLQLRTEVMAHAPDAAGISNDSRLPE